MTKNVINFALLADEIALVTTPEPSAITDAYAMVKVIHGEKPDARIGLIVNMARTDMQAKSSRAVSLFAVEREARKQNLKGPFVGDTTLLSQKTIELAAEAANVRVAVIEAPARRAELGLGYSTDAKVRELFPRTVIMDEGRIVEEGPPDQMFSDPKDPRTRQFLDRLLRTKPD